MSFVQSPTLAPTMHPKVTEPKSVFIQNNQLPSKNSVERNGNSNVIPTFEKGRTQKHVKR